MEQEFYNRGLEKVLQGDLNGAIEDFDQALQVNPHFADAYYKRGLTHFDLGDKQGAIADYTQALQLNPESIENYFGRALARLALDDTQGGLEDANQILRLNSNHAPAHKLQGTIYRRLGETQTAIASLKKAAELYLDQKDTVNCRRCLDTISQIQDSQRLAISVAQTEVFCDRAIKKVNQGNYRAALEDFNWLLQIDPRNAKAYCYRGIIYSKLGNPQGAIQDLAQAMQLSPHDPQIRNHRGLIRIELEDYRGAIEDFNQLLQLNPENAQAYANRGHAYRRMGNYRQAIEDYSRALTLKPNKAQFYCCRAVARADFEDYQGAIDDYQKAANLYFDQQDWQNYKRVLEKIKQQNSKASSAAQKRTSKLNSEDVFLDQEKQIWSNVQATSELQTRLLRMVGGHWEVAERLIELAKRRNPGMPENWYLEKVIEDLESDR